MNKTMHSAIYYHENWIKFCLRCLRWRTRFLMLTMVLLFAFTAHSQTINLSGEPVSFKELFKEIKKQTGYVVAFDEEHLKNLPSVKLSKGAYRLTEVLDKALNPNGLSYTISSKTIFIAKVAKKPQPEKLQNDSKLENLLQPVQGRVTDEKGKPMEGVSISLAGTGKGTFTDANGRYLLDQVPDDGALIIFSFIGYHQQEITVINNTSTIDVVMHINEADAVASGVTIFTGVQKIPRERATGSFIFIDSTLLNHRVSTNIIDRLEGIVPGVLFNRNASASQDKPDISIRGRSTLFANAQPLIVVDGFPYDGDLSNINPNDIENISILKDAAAASIWGVRSGNGVIVLTTKTGKAGDKFEINFNSNITVGDKPDIFYNPNFMSSKDLISVEKQLFDKQFYDSYIDDVQQVISPVVQALYANKNALISDGRLNNILDSLSGMDVRNDILKYYYRKSLAQQYALSLAGGGNKYTYRFSFGYDQNNFSLVGNKNKRTTFSLANTFHPIKNLEFQSNIYLVNENIDNNNTLSDLTVAGLKRSMYPYATLADANGNPTTIERGYNGTFINAAAATGKYENWNYYPLDELKYADNTSRNLDNRIILGLKYKIISGLDLSVNYQYEKQILEDNNYYSAQTYYVRDLYNMYLDTASGYGPVPTGGILNYQRTNLISNRVRALLGYNNNIGKHGILTGILGSEVSNVRTTGAGNTAYGYDKSTSSSIDVDFSNYYPAAPSGSYNLIPKNNGFSGFTDRLISYFGNAGYVWDRKYIVSVSGRIDKSNLFGVQTNKKSVPLYSTGIAWDISKENFYRLSWLPYLKLRATYGYNGNVDKTAAAVTTIQQLNNSYYTGYHYAQILNPNNPQLQWEKTKILNFGVDFALKSDVLSGSVEYYKKTGINLIGYSALPPSSGLTEFKGNTANSTGSGIDIQLIFKLLKNRNFSWTSVINYSHTIDKVSRYEDQSNVYSYLATDAGYISPIEGKPVFSIFAYKWAGLDESGNPQGILDGKPSTNYIAIINSATIDSLAFIGSARPTRYGSFMNTFSYKSFSLSFNIVYKLGYYFRRNSINYSNLFYNSLGHRDFTNRWQNPGDELHTNVPSLIFPYNANREGFYRSTEVLVVKGDHIRFQDVNLSYKILVGKAWGNVVKSAYLYFYANNIGILWRANKNRLDPDTYGSSLPMPRSYSFGIKCSF